MEMFFFLSLLDPIASVFKIVQLKWKKWDLRDLSLFTYYISFTCTDKRNQLMQLIISVKCLK